MTPLRAFRREKEITLKALAPFIGVSESQLSRIEREGTPLLRIALKLAEITEEPVESFLKEVA